MAWHFARGLGVFGIWIGFSLSVATFAVLLVWRFHAASAVAAAGALPGRSVRSDSARRVADTASTMVEQLTIARLGRRGDGIAETPAGPLYVPYTLPGETAEVEAWPGHPDRRRLHPDRGCEPRAHRADLPAFRRLRRLRAAALGARALSRLEARRSSSRRWRRPASTCRSTTLIDAHGEGRRRAVFHARRGTRDVLEVGFAALRAHHIVAIDRCPILAPGLDGAIEAAWAIAEALGADAQAARHPGDRDREPGSTSTCAARGR